MRCLDLVGELVAVRSEQFYAVVEIRIVRGGDHHAHVSAQRARQHGDRGRRDRPEQEHVHAGGGQPGHHGVLDHVAGQPRVLAEHHPVAVIAALEGQAGRHADLHRDFGGHWKCIGFATDAVRAEIFAGHLSSSPQSLALAAPLARVSATERDAPRITFGEFMLRTLRNHCRFTALVKIGNSPEQCGNETQPSSKVLTHRRARSLQGRPKSLSRRKPC